MKLCVVYMGMMDYMEAFDLQNKLLSMRQQGRIEDLLLLLQHPPVLTIGRSGSRQNIIVSDSLLEQNKVGIHDINRGGDITYHGPGQIVGYPIVDLTHQGKDVRVFVRGLEEVFISLLREEYGILAGRDPQHTGVWVENEKITAIGLAVKRWVTQHGFAFNVNTNLDHFQWINPCGIVDKGVTSLEKLLGKALDMDVLFAQTADYFAQEFRMEINCIEKEELLAMAGREA